MLIRKGIISIMSIVTIGMIIIISHHNRISGITTVINIRMIICVIIIIIIAKETLIWSEHPNRNHGI